MADLTEAQIMEILAGTAGVTPGPWRVYNGCSWRRIGTEPGRGNYDCAVLAPCVAPDGHPDLTSSSGNREANLDHIARLDPATVAALCNMALDRAAAEAKIAERAEEIEQMQDALLSCARAIGDWAILTGANGMTTPQSDHTLLTAMHKADAAVAEIGSGK